MRYSFPKRAAALFVCRSAMPLHAVCQVLQQQYALPPFHLDEHSTWEYAATMGLSIGFNITKTERLDTIQQWMQNVQFDVNYQIIVYINEPYPSAPSNQLPSKNDVVDDVHVQLNKLYNVSVQRVNM